MGEMRILSLLPAATEIVYLLGLEKYLVGVSHACDYPPQAKLKPKITSANISNILSSRQIDAKVKKSLHRGSGVFHIDQGLLKKLKPDLILTQEICEVCALTPSVILRSGATKDLKIKKAKSGDSSLVVQNDNLKIISLEPQSVEDILENVRFIGEVGGKKKEAIRVVRKLRRRLEKIQTRLPRPFGARNDRKRVLVIEWLDPIMVAGHWVPQMIEIAGGINLFTKPGTRSKILTIKQVRSSKPDILVISPCGFDIQRTIKEKELIARIVKKVGVVSGKVYLVDGNSYMTRPGSRIIDGIEILSEILHPKIFPRKHPEKAWQLLSSLT